MADETPLRVAKKIVRAHRRVTGIRFDVAEADFLWRSFLGEWAEELTDVGLGNMPGDVGEDDDA